MGRLLVKHAWPHPTSIYVLTCLPQAYTTLSMANFHYAAFSTTLPSLPTYLYIDGATWAGDLPCMCLHSDRNKKREDAL